MAEKPKDVHIDLLAIDMETGVHWLHPLEKNKHRLVEIRERNRAKWLAEQKANAESKKKEKALELEARAGKKTVVELWPETDESRADFMGRCITDLTKCVGPKKAPRICATKWRKSEKLGKKSAGRSVFIARGLDDTDAIEACGEACVGCDGADAPFGKAFDPGEPRDDEGKWTDGGGDDGSGGGAIAVDANKPVDPGESKQITPQEKKSIDKYQSKSGFKKINKPLREGAAPGDDAKNLSSAIAKHSLTKEATVYRGVGNTLSKQLTDAWENKKPGEAVTFTDKGFVSTSTRRGTAAVFSNQMIKLTIPQGHHVLPIVGKMPGEAEILLNSGSKFKVISVGPGVTQGSKLFEVELMS